MGVGGGLYMYDVVKKVHVRYLISWWVLVLIPESSHSSSTMFCTLKQKEWACQLLRGLAAFGMQRVRLYCTVYSKNSDGIV